MSAELPEFERTEATDEINQATIDTLDLILETLGQRGLSEAEIDRVVSNLSDAYGLYRRDQVDN